MQTDFAEVRGPVGSEDADCRAGVACTLGAYSGEALTASDRALLVATPAAPPSGIGVTKCADTARDLAANIARGALLDVQAPQFTARRGR